MKETKKAIPEAYSRPSGVVPQAAARRVRPGLPSFLRVLGGGGRTDGREPGGGSERWGDEARAGLGAGEGRGRGGRGREGSALDEPSQVEERSAELRKD